MENKEIIKNIEEAKKKMDLLIQWYKKDIDNGIYGDVQLAISWIIEPLKNARIQCVKNYELKEMEQENE